MIPVAGTVVAERFRLVRPLGQGGMGSVWLADHLGLDIPCAIKFIQAESKDSAEVRQRFEREAKIAAQIRSPHVVQVLDHGVWEETPYIAMECLEGEDLDDRLLRVGRLSAVETAAITAQVARALARAHAAGLVHRDLKPANIFLAHDDDREIVKVLDFGIAKDSTPRLAAGSNTKTGSILGTPVYMSPEQAQGVKAIDHRSDLWSLGVVIFECMTGQLPFQSEAFGDLLLKIMVHPLPVPSQLAPVPLAFDAWWARAAARDPEQRFQSAKELSDALILSLGVSSGDAGGIRLSISDTFSIPGIDRNSLVGLARASSPSLDDLGPRSLAEATKIIVSDPAAGAISSGIAATLQGAGAGDLGAVAERRVRAQTAGPMSTSLSGDVALEPASRRRIALAAIAGVMVAIAGALLLLRGGGAPSASAPSTEAPVPVTAEPPSQAAPAAPPVVPAPLEAATLDPMPPPDTAAPAAHGAPTPRGTSVATAIGRPGAPAAPSPRPKGSARPTPKKKSNPNDFGI